MSISQLVILLCVHTAVPLPLSLSLSLGDGEGRGEGQEGGGVGSRGNDTGCVYSSTYCIALQDLP